MNAFFRYVGYTAISMTIGYFSSLMSPEADILYKLSNNLIQILITIVVAYGTLSNILLAQLAIFVKEKGAEIHSAISEMKRSLAFEIIILVAVFILFIVLGVIEDKKLVLWVIEYKRMIVNSITFFSLFYYIYIVVDCTLGLYSIVSKNCE